MTETASDLQFDVLADNVGVQVNLTRRALWNRAAAARKHGRQRRPSGYLSTLVMIGANPGVSQRRLADALVLDVGAMSDIVDLLEREGLAERRRDPADRRRAMLYLTEAGLAACEEARELNRQQDRLVTACLTAEETVTLLALLKRLRA